MVRGEPSGEACRTDVDEAVHLAGFGVGALGDMVGVAVLAQVAVGSVALGAVGAAGDVLALTYVDVLAEGKASGALGGGGGGDDVGQYFAIPVWIEYQGKGQVFEMHRAGEGDHDGGGSARNFGDVSGERSGREDGVESELGEVVVVVDQGEGKDGNSMDENLKVQGGLGRGGQGNYKGGNGRGNGRGVAHEVSGAEAGTSGENNDPVLGEADQAEGEG